MNKSNETKAITESLQAAARATAAYRRQIAELNWQLARQMASFRETYGTAASKELMQLLEREAGDDDAAGFSHSKVEKLFIIGHFSDDDLKRFGIPEIDPFVFLQHKSEFVEHKTKKLIDTPKAREVLEALKNGASDFELRKVRGKGTKY